MPTYGYQCAQNKHEFSVFQSMKDDPIATCPECGSPVKRLLYPVGVVFKGSGWYINDSRKPDKSESASEKPAETKSADNATSDSKATDSTASDSTASDSKTTESKPGDSKTEVAPKAEPKETAASKA